MSNTLFSADPHYGHSNIIGYCDRPFSSTDEMNEVLVKNWNSVVHKDDTVYLLGDVSFKNLFDWKNRLNGHIVVVKGNHDSKEHKLVKGYIHYGGYYICLTHKPENADFTKEICLCGHVHNRWKFKKYKREKDWGYLINVGVDVWNFTPITFEKIFSELQKVKDSVEEFKDEDKN